MQEFEITANEAGQRFDKLLAKHLKLAPKSFLYKMLRKKNITLNGKKADGSEKLVQGDKVKLFLSDDTISKFSSDVKPIEIKSDLDIIYKDNNIMLINKPAGMLSQKAAASDISVNEHIIAYLLENNEITLKELQTFKPSICNRLDRNTSGLIAAGISLTGLQTLGEMFKDRTLSKYYRCLVDGIVTDSAYIKGFLYKDEETNCVTVSDIEKEGYLPIETEYTPVVYGVHCTLLEVKLITGRTHQIRAHLASIGHPIIGDSKYGNTKTNQQYKVRHQLLHSYRIEFPDIDNEAMANLSGQKFTAELPKIYNTILEKKD